MTVSIGLGRVGLGPNFSICSGLGWVTKNGPMDNSAADVQQKLTYGHGTAPFRMTLDALCVRDRSLVHVQLRRSREDI